MSPFGSSLVEKDDDDDDARRRMIMKMIRMRMRMQHHLASMDIRHNFVQLQVEVIKPATVKALGLMSDNNATMTISQLHN